MAYQSLHDRLKDPVVKGLQEDLKIKNKLALPRIEKVTVNVGINKSKIDSKEMHAYIEECLMKITGQKPVFTKAKAAISNFKIRENMIIGAMVTLRGHKMEEFLDRLLSYALPRVRDFRGVTTKLDGHGNYAIGIRDQSIFPEVPPPDAKQIFGMQIQLTTTTDDDEEARALLKQIGVPFRPEKSASEKEEEARKAQAAEEKKAQEEALKPAKEEEKEVEESEESKETEDNKEKASSDSSDSSGSSEEKGNEPFASKDDKADTSDSKS